MNGSYQPRLRATLVGLVLLLQIGDSSAAQSGLFSYEVADGNTVTITGYPTDVSGDVTIPATIAGLPLCRQQYQWLMPTGGCYVYMPSLSC